MTKLSQITTAEGQFGVRDGILLLLFVLQESRL